MEVEKIRLFVGGLGSEVSAGDLQERFAPLGNVKNITLPAAKAGAPGHRGFAYVDFVPATDASLRKLLSAYNGCKWRGGLLRIEKAKEHYADKLDREWAVEVVSSTGDPPSNPTEVVQKSSLTGDWRSQVNGFHEGDIKASELKIFFPRLRKLKNVPLTGLGKHKRSFQRLESSPLQLLSYCACEESVLSGSCSCSKIDRDTSSSKQDTGCEKDDISLEIEIERQRQLELLSRLFPSDPTSISLESQQVVELDNNEENGIIKCEGTVGSTEHTEEALLPPITEMVEQGGSKRSLQCSAIQSVVGKGHNEQLDSKMDSENTECDSTAISVAKERAKQLELLERLFPADAASTREQVLQPEVDKVKKKRKLDASGNSLQLVKTPIVASRGTTTEHALPINNGFSDTNTGQQSAEHQKLAMKQGDEAIPFEIGVDQEMRLAESIPEVRSDDLLNNASEMVLNLEDDPAPLQIAEDQDRQFRSKTAVTTDGLEHESEVVLYVGDDSLPLENVREQKTNDVKNLSMKANNSIDKVSEISPHVRDDSLSLVYAEERERQAPDRPQKVIFDDGLEDSEMTLNLGDNSVPLSKAEEEERALVRMLPTWELDEARPNDDTSSDPEDSEEADATGTEEPSSEEDDHSERSSDAEDDEAVDSENEEHDSELVDHSESSSDAEEADEAVGDTDDEGHVSEEDDAFHAECSETRKNNSQLAQGSPQMLQGKQPDESMKWAALTEMCQFRTGGIMQSEERKPEGNSTTTTRSNQDEDIPSTELPDLQAAEVSTTSQQQTDAEYNRGNSDNPSNSGQKLTRAAWKSLVGETGRVVFSLNQLIGSNLPQTASLTQETKTIEDAGTQVEPIFSSKASNQSQVKPKLTICPSQKKHVGVRSYAERKKDATELTKDPATPVVFSSDVCPFMKSENAEDEWLATKSDLRSDYRAKQKYASRTNKKLWGKR